MKTKHDATKSRPVVNGSVGKWFRPEYCTLMAIGAVIALMLLSGCSSAPVGGDYDAWRYNTVTGYPAVGGPFQQR